MGMTATIGTDRKLRLTRTHVAALLNGGLLADGRYELLSGESIQQMPQNKPYVNALRRTLSVFEDTFGRDFVGSQSPVIIDETNEPEYWVLDVNLRRLIVHREPQDDGYGSIETLGEDSSVSPLAAPNASISVSSLLP